MTTPRIISLDEQTSSGTLVDGKTSLAAVNVITDNTNDATVIFYDNTAASGKKVFETTVDGATGGALFNFTRPVQCKIGLHLSISGTGASCIPYTG